MGLNFYLLNYLTLFYLNSKDGYFTNVKTEFIENFHPKNAIG